MLENPDLKSSKGIYNIELFRIFSEEQAYILGYFFVASKYTFCFPDHVIFDMATFILRADHDNFCVYNNL